QARFGIVHSEFSRSDLHHAGCASVAVVPPLGEFLVGDVPDETSQPATHASDRPGAQWLFVGRLSPHKGAHDLVKALSCYRKLFDPEARLTLVGSPLGDDYPRALVRFAMQLGVDDAVRITGSVDARELVRFYGDADVFVCASDHEGFCVPLVEAMHMGVPVVAFDAAAVGDTARGAALLVADKSPLTLASAVHRVMTDEPLASMLRQAGRRRAARFSLDAASARMAEAIKQAVELVTGSSE
ncbi:MAG: glycosyltransferase, partial [Acidimicrobiales bacterium]